MVMPPGKSGGKRDFGFIHYAERSSALKAVKDTEKYEIDGTFSTLNKLINQLFLQVCLMFFFLLSCFSEILCEK